MKNLLQEQERWRDYVLIMTGVNTALRISDLPNYNGGMYIILRLPLFITASI